MVSAEAVGNKILTTGAELMLLSLTTGECLTEHNLNVPFHNSICTNWKAESASWKIQNNTINVLVEGSYSEAKGKITYRFADDGTLEVSYKMNSKIRIKPRQFGMVFTVPEDVKNLEW